MGHVTTHDFAIYRDVVDGAYQFMDLLLGRYLALLGARSGDETHVMLVAVDDEYSLLLTGTGDVIEPDNNVLAIGSGGPYAQAAALALVENSELDAEEICKASMKIAADICVFTNHSTVIEKI